MKVNVRKRGKVYQFYIETATIAGRRNRISQSGYKTKKEAEEAGFKTLTRLYSGVAYEPCKMSYSDFLDIWMHKWVEINLKYHTMMTYRNIIKIHLKPNIGFYSMDQLTAPVISDMMTNIYIKHSYSKSYMRGILKIVKGSLSYAFDVMNLIPENPALKVHVPKYDIPPHDPAHIFTKEEISTILNRFKDTHTIYYSLLTAYFTGMRLGEVYGLTWDCVDFVNKTITVNKNLVKRDQVGSSHRSHAIKDSSTAVWYLGTCKTQTSYRTIPIGDTLVKALKSYKKEQEENKKIFGEAYIMHYQKEVNNPYTNKPEIKVISAISEIPLKYPVADFLFVKNNGYFLGTETSKYAMKVIHYELGIPCRFHDFRDTHATRLVESGADIKAVSKRLGHATINTTYNIYVRVTNKMEQETANTFEEYADIKLEDEKGQENNENEERSTNEELRSDINS